MGGFKTRVEQHAASVVSIDLMGMTVNFCTWPMTAANVYARTANFRWVVR